jgi:dTDP-4-dehydrorhamnose 3,5-epimerase
LEGIRIQELKKIPDERGFFAELLRMDWNQLLNGEWIKQVNFSFSYPNIIRAWHRHQKGQVDYFVVLQGAMKISVYDEVTKNLEEIISSEHRLQIVRVPGHYWHGTKTIGNIPSLLVYFVTKLYDYLNPDEDRLKWNDPTIVRAETKLPYDWNEAPFK